MSRPNAALMASLLVVVAVGGLGVLAETGVLAGGRVTPTVAGAVPRFVEETATAGLAHTYDGGSAYLEGGGIAAFDCTGDGRPELYVAGGTNPAALYRNASATGGALAFSPISDPVTDMTGVEGAYPIDIDGDGTTDLAILTVHGAHLLRGLGGCRFEPADAAFGFDGGAGWTTAFSATWEGGTTLPTLAIGTYQLLDAKGDPTFTCDTSRLVRPVAGAGTYGPPVILTPGHCTLSMLFSDWDRSGRRDLRVTNDRHYDADGSDQLWRVAPGEAPRAYTADDGWVAMQIWGMGIASYDLTGDRYPEFYLTSQGDNKLQTLTRGPEQPTYRDIALKRGVNVPNPFTGGDVAPSTAWHPEFTDVNDDGFVDLFVSKGNVSIDPEFARKDPSNLLMGSPAGTFTEAADTAGILSFDRGRGATLADLNGDGLPDLVEVNMGAPVRAWRSVGAGSATAPAAMGHWLDVAATEPAPNRDAIGAWIEVRVGDTVLRREITVGGGHLGGTLAPAHFGLGSATAVDVRVQWPDGEQGPWLATTVDGVVVVDRGTGTIAPRRPAAP